MDSQGKVEDQDQVTMGVFKQDIILREGSVGGSLVVMEETASMVDQDHQDPTQALGMAERLEGATIKVALEDHLDRQEDMLEERKEVAVLLEVLYLVAVMVGLDMELSSLARIDGSGVFYIAQCTEFG